MSYSAKSTGVPLNELVSITSQPTSRNAVCTFSTASGRVISRCSLQPSNRRPPKSSSERFWTCRLVPIAPSKTTMRSRNVSRKLLIKLLLLNVTRQHQFVLAEHSNRARVWTSGQSRGYHGARLRHDRLINIDNFNRHRQLKSLQISIGIRWVDRHLQVLNHVLV